MGLMSMTQSDLSQREHARLHALKRYHVLDTPREPAFDDLTALAAIICGVPIAFISFVDAHRLWLKSMIGIELSEASRTDSLCSHAIEQSSTLIIKDLLSDSRFSKNHLVTSATAARYYAGQPLVTHDGHAIGVLCVMDTKPRELTAQQILSLQQLSRQAMFLLENRFNLSQLDHTNQILDRTSQMAKVGGWELDLLNATLHWTPEVFAIHELPPTKTPTLEEALGFYTEAAQQELKQAIDLAIAEHREWDLELPFVTAKKNEIWVRAQGKAIFDGGRPICLEGSFQDITAQKLAQIKLTWVNRALHLLRYCNQALLHVKEVERLIHEICELIVNEGGYSFAWVGEVDLDNNTHIVPLGFFGNGENYLKDNHLSWQPDTRIGNGPCGEAIRTGKMVCNDDIQTSASQHTQLLRTYGYSSVISLPLKDDTDHTIGLLAIYSNQSHQHSEEELALISNLSENLALGIVQIRRETERRKVTTAISKIANALNAVSNDDFFEQLVYNMIGTLNASAGYVARLHTEPLLKLQTLAVVVDERVEPNFEFAVSDSLSQSLFDEDSVKIIRANAHTHPVFKHLSLMRFYPYEAFAGFRLSNSQNETFGLIFVFFKNKISESLEYLVRSTVTIFASRTASEIERIDDAFKIQERAALLDKSRDAMIVRDMNNKVTYWNHAAQSLYGWSESEALHADIVTLLQIDAEEFAHSSQQLLEYGEWFGDRVEYHKNGHPMVVEIRSTLVRDKFGNPRSIFSIKNDITDRKHKENEIRKLAYHDTLTQLPNRRLFLEKLVQAIATCHTTEKYAALFFIDLDNFKTLNDMHGHEVGDLLLQQVAIRLTSQVRDNDIVARLGGDEFVVLIEQIATDAETAKQNICNIATKLLKAFHLPFELQSLTHPATPSIGAKIFSRADRDPDQIIKQADMAMYASKKRGRNQFNLVD